MVYTTCLTYCSPCRFISEGELFTSKNAVLEIFHISFAKLKIIDLSEDISDVSEKSHVTELCGSEDFFPRHTTRLLLLPCFLVFLNINLTSSHQLIQYRRVCMSKTNCIDHSDLCVLVLINLVSTEIREFISKTSLEYRWHICLVTFIDEKVVSTLRSRFICSHHYFSIILIELAGVLFRPFFPLGMNSCTNHDYLRIQPHIVILS